MTFVSSLVLVNYARSTTPLGTWKMKFTMSVERGMKSSSFIIFSCDVSKWSQAILLQG